MSVKCDGWEKDEKVVVGGNESGCLIVVVLCDWEVKGLFKFVKKKDGDVKLSVSNIFCDMIGFICCGLNIF